MVPLVLSGSKVCSSAAHPRILACALHVHTICTHACTCSCRVLHATMPIYGQGKVPVYTAGTQPSIVFTIKCKVNYSVTPKHPSSSVCCPLTCSSHSANIFIEPTKM